jgi:ankyrin repeat protein
MQAASEGDTELMRLLLRYGADVMATNEENERPLGFACAWNQPDAAKVLLQHGADPNLPEDVHATYLDWAITSGHTDLAEVLRSHAAVRYTELVPNGG